MKLKKKNSKQTIGDKWTQQKNRKHGRIEIKSIHKPNDYLWALWKIQWKAIHCTETSSDKPLTQTYQPTNRQTHTQLFCENQKKKKRKINEFM